MTMGLERAHRVKRCQGGKVSGSSVSEEVGIMLGKWAPILLTKIMEPGKRDAPV